MSGLAHSCPSQPKKKAHGGGHWRFASTSSIMELINDYQKLCNSIQILKFQKNNNYGCLQEKLCTMTFDFKMCFSDLQISSEIFIIKKTYC